MPLPLNQSSGCSAQTHKLAELADGRCHYRVEGPASGITLVMIHGATVPAWQFDRLVPLLVRAGIRTIRLDLFGHGYSARPLVVHDYTLFTRQVFELLEQLGMEGEVQLLGHSLGAVVAARLMLAAPGKFGSLVMIAPMLDFLGDRKAMRLLRVPLFGEALMHGCVIPMLVRRRSRRYRNIQDGKFVKMFHDQLAVPGFGRSLLALVRSDALEDQRTCYRALGELEAPVMLLSGGSDQTATPTQLEILRDSLPGAKFHVIEGATHALILTHPQHVASHVIPFLTCFRDG
jgi:pimeloyl-ACP methyl ester carboxylesterase